MPLPTPPIRLGDQVDTTQPDLPEKNKSSKAQKTSALVSQKNDEKKQILPSVSTKKTPTDSSSKLFVLDTNVLLHDPTSLFSFAEHDVFLPMIVLEELDHNKKGLNEVSRNAREVNRNLDTLVQNITDLDKGVNLNRLGHTEAKGFLFLQTSHLEAKLNIDLPISKADNQILHVVQALKNKFKSKQIILISKDINIRLKARALGLESDDYLNDHTIDDSDLLHEGMTTISEDKWHTLINQGKTWSEAGATLYQFKGNFSDTFHINQFIQADDLKTLNLQVKEVQHDTVTFSSIRDYTQAKNHVWGIVAKNKEQNFALNLLMNPDIDFITLLGQAGTGKTLLTLAAGLTQVLETRRYTEIIMTRVTVPVGEDIGFLPGTEEEKMNPWMGALEDNLEFLHSGNNHKYIDEWNKSFTKEMIESYIKVKSLNFMRGRTFLNKFLIIDEAQNLTPKQMKTLITRAGPGTKIICLGNIAQIDTPYLTEGSSGLSYVVERFKGWQHAGHITLQKGERSRLADFASDAL